MRALRRKNQYTKWVVYMPLATSSGKPPAASSPRRPDHFFRRAYQQRGDPCLLAGLVRIGPCNSLSIRRLCGFHDMVPAVRADTCSQPGVPPGAWVCKKIRLFAVTLSFATTFVPPTSVATPMAALEPSTIAGDALPIKYWVTSAALISSALAAPGFA